LSYARFSRTRTASRYPNLIRSTKAATCTMSAIEAVLDPMAAAAANEQLGFAIPVQEGIMAWAATMEARLSMALPEANTLEVIFSR
jgi:hypothetical protein